MKNIIKTTAYSVVALATTATTFAVDYGQTEVGTNFGQGQSTNIKSTIYNVLSAILTFTAFVAIAFALYGGFQILTAAGDDDKAKKGKTTLIRALLGLFVILTAWTIVGWLFSSATTVVTTGKVQ